MKGLALGLFVVAAIFAFYGIVTHYNTTAAGQPFLHRVWAAMLASVLAAGSALVAWIHGMTAPPA
jgi:hypothetical protein